MNSYAMDLLHRYAGRGILLDSNLLIVFVVGLYDPTMIRRFDKTSGYGQADFELLATIQSLVKRVVTTPSILTEVSNLAGQLPAWMRESVFQRFAEMIALTEERYVESQEIATEAHLHEFGLTDIGIGRVARGELLVLTADERLVGYLHHLGIDALHYRSLR